MKIQPTKTSIFKLTIDISGTRTIKSKFTSDGDHVIVDKANKYFDDFPTLKMILC